MEEDRECRSAYDTLRGHLMGLAIDTAAKAYLLRHLDVLYERILSSQESAASAEKRGGLAGYQGDVSTAS